MKTLAIALIVLMVAPISSAATSSNVAADEYEIKAAIYVNLLRLVDWPADKRGDISSPIVIGVSGSDDMARALEAIAQSKSVSVGRRIVVRRISGIVELDECHSVFVGGGDRKRMEAALQTLGASPVLTVGEDERFVGLGGMIDLLLKEDRVRIEVNLDVLRNAGLTISSQLLKIAVVKTGGK